MKKQISSDATILWKYFVPGWWIAVMGVLAVVVAFQTATAPAWILFPLGWIIASGYVIWFARRLKSVSIDDDFLYVSQGRKQIQIPLTDIKHVKENFLTKSITLTVNQPTEFGTEIVFVPELLPFAAFRSHTIVQEIESAVQRRRSPTC
jgi:hypothetical protein